MTLNKQDRIGIINAHIIDVENGSYYPPQVSLVIQNGRIIAMPGLPGQPDNIPVDVSIDLHGLTVIPGLFNTHCHLQFLQQDERGQKQIAKNLADCLNRGITNVRDTLCYDLRLNQKWMDRINTGEILGPRIHQAVHVSPLGGTYAPRPTLMTRFSFSLIGLKLIDYNLPYSGAVVFRPGAGPQEVRDSVDRAIDERGATAIKLCDQPEHFMSYKPGAQVISAEQLNVAVDQAIKRGLPTTMHNVTLAGFRQGIKAGIGSLAHLPLDMQLNDMDLQLFLGSNSYLEPTVSVGYFMSYSVKGSPFINHPEIRRLDQLRAKTYQSMVAETWIPELLPNKLAMDAALKKGEMKVFGIMDISEPFRYYARMIPIGGQNLKLLVNYGAATRLGCGNDAGPNNCSAADIRYEHIMLDFILNIDSAPVFSTADQLRLSTIQSARAMGLDAQFGSIQVGKVADLAIVDGDPLQDVHLIGEPVRALFMDGKLVVDRAGLLTQAHDGI